MIDNCELCPRFCRTLRTDTYGYGFCGLPDKFYISHYGLHNFEEPVISCKNGSGTIFFSGCNLRCDYCQNFKISRTICGKEVTIEEFINIMKELENDMKAENINLVTPTPYSKLILEALKIYKPKIPIVYNTSGYERPEIIKELLPYVDIFLTDFKYGYDEIAEKYSHCKNYVHYAIESLKVMMTKENIVKDGKMYSGVIVRHLILPNNIKNTFEVLNILNNLKVQTISIMSQFTPINNNCDLNRTIDEREYKKVIFKLSQYNFDGYTQDLNSSGIEYVPKFKFVK